MVEPVTLLVPVEEPYRTIAVDVARKYVQGGGGSDEDADAAARELTHAMADIASGAARDSEITITFELDAGSVVMRIRCGTMSVTVKRPLPARKLS
jgi:hypothetical protein